MDIFAGFWVMHLDNKLIEVVEGRTGKTNATIGIFLISLNGLGIAAYPVQFCSWFFDCFIKDSYTGILQKGRFVFWTMELLYDRADKKSDIGAFLEIWIAGKHYFFVIL